MAPQKISLIFIKIAIMAVLLWYAFEKNDLSSVALRFADTHIPWAALGFAILLLQLLITGIRWHIASEAIDAGISRYAAIKLTLIGQFFNQVLPSSFGGDAVRAVLLSREGLSVRRALASVLCDRITALLMLVVISLATLAAALALTNNLAFLDQRLLLLLSSASLFGIFLFAGRKNRVIGFLSKISLLRPIFSILSDLKVILFSQETGHLVLLLSAIVQVLIVFSFYFLGLALGIKLTYVHLLVLPFITLISSLPFSFAGWGIRENAMMAGLGFFGLPSADSLALSVGFGIGQAVIGLPGLVIFLLPKIQKTNRS